MELMPLARMCCFQRVTKGGAGIAGEFGEGVLQLKGETVNYYSVGSASIGLALGVGVGKPIIGFVFGEKGLLGDLGTGRVAILAVALLCMLANRRH